MNNPSEVVSIGDELEVKVLEFDRDRERISLGLKQLQAYPWTDVDQKYPEDSIVKGKVVSITNYGAFVELEKGIEGLIHISEMSWTRNVRHPSKIVSIGDEVETMVLRVDKDNEKISLGLKQAEPDPGGGPRDEVTRRVPASRARCATSPTSAPLWRSRTGSMVWCTSPDMSWTKRVRHPKEIVKKGDGVDVMILDINKEKRRISLGIKQLVENPWEDLAELFAQGTECKGKVVRMLEHGAIVEIEDQVEGFVPLQHLGISGIEKPQEHFTLEEELPLVVIKIQPESRKIVLSATEYFSTHADELEAYVAAHPKRELTEEELESIAREQDEELDRELAAEDN